MGRKGHVPVRMCAGCLKRRPKKELVRLGLNHDGGLVVDSEQFFPGRGVYLCPGSECLELAIKKKGFVRAFRGKFRQVLPEEVFRAFQEERECRK
jgi:predicted RNA-binding protein YlxR (DUF448 family)